MAHVKLARDIGGRHHDRKRFPASVHLGVEIFLFHPVCVNPILQTKKRPLPMQRTKSFAVPPCFVRGPLSRAPHYPITLVRRGQLLPSSLSRLQSYLPQTLIPGGLPATDRPLCMTLFFAYSSFSMPFFLLAEGNIAGFLPLVKSSGSYIHHTASRNPAHRRADGARCPSHRTAAPWAFPAGPEIPGSRWA